MIGTRYDAPERTAWTLPLRTPFSQRASAQSFDSMQPAAGRSQSEVDAKAMRAAAKPAEVEAPKKNRLWEAPSRLLRWAAAGCAAIGLAALLTIASLSHHPGPAPVQHAPPAVTITVPATPGPPANVVVAPPAETTPAPVATVTTPGPTPAPSTAPATTSPGTTPAPATSPATTSPATTSPAATPAPATAPTVITPPTTTPTATPPATATTTPAHGTPAHGASGVSHRPTTGFAPLRFDKWHHGPNDCLEHMLENHGFSLHQIYARDHHGVRLIDRAAQLNHIHHINKVFPGQLFSMAGLHS